MLVTLMLSLKTPSMDNAHVALATLMTTTVHLLGQNCACDDDDNCLHSLMFTSMDKAHVALATLMPTLLLSTLAISLALTVVPPYIVCPTRHSAQNVCLPTQFVWYDIALSTLRSKSMLATTSTNTPTDTALILQLLIYIYYSSATVLLHVSVTLRDSCGFLLIMGGLSSNVTLWLLKHGGSNFVAQMKLILGLSFVAVYMFGILGVFT